MKTYKVQVECDDLAKDTLGAVCAKKQIDILGYGEENRDEVIKISKNFGVLSSQTAMICKLKVT